jgi:WD repeat-containing protein 23
MTPDNRFLIYSTITPVVHLASLDNGEALSVANVTDIHESIYMSERDDEYGEGIWSLRFSPDSQRQILAGSSSSVYVYDMAAQKVERRLRQHQDDVNAVEYADETGRVFFSGSDDALIYAWDLRVAKTKPVGAFIGHLSGITFLQAAGDGRLLLSNSKDQTAKTWDMRLMSSFEEAKNERKMRDVPRVGIDYRWQAWPRRCRSLCHPRDTSLVTFRGHQVLQTLIRAHFSPHYTSMRYVYAGSADGNVYIWDAYRGGSPLRCLSGGHDDVVRDCSWHPNVPLITSMGFDGKIISWKCEQ